MSALGHSRPKARRTHSVPLHPIAAGAAKAMRWRLRNLTPIILTPTLKPIPYRCTLPTREQFDYHCYPMRSIVSGDDMFRLPKSKGYTRTTRVLVIIVVAISSTIIPRTSQADQGGVGFWLPGTFGSLAATPLQPGLSMSAIYLHSSVSAGGNVAASRTIQIPPNRPVNLSINLDAQIKGTADVVAFGPTYVFPTPVFGGQFAVTALGIAGRQQAAIDALVTGALGPIGFATEQQHLRFP